MPECDDDGVHNLNTHPTQHHTFPSAPGTQGEFGGDMNRPWSAARAALPGPVGTTQWLQRQIT